VQFRIRDFSWNGRPAGRIKALQAVNVSRKTDLGLDIVTVIMWTVADWVYSESLSHQRIPKGVHF
jgi:hypothetical protein